MKKIYQSQPRVKYQHLTKEEWQKKLLQDLKKIPGFYKAYFFGSYARGKEEPWSDVDIIILLEDKGFNGTNNQNFFQNLLFVSDYLIDYPELEFLVYTIKQWEEITSDPHPIGFWRDVRRDMVELV